jgi:hypothetical protein
MNLLKVEGVIGVWLGVGVEVVVNLPQKGQLQCKGMDQGLGEGILDCRGVDQGLGEGVLDCRGVDQVLEGPTGLQRGGSSTRGAYWIAKGWTY